jgi:hypothetical protein
MKLRVSADVNEYIYFHRYPSAVENIEFDVEVGSVVDAVAPSFSIHLYTA